MSKVYVASPWGRRDVAASVAAMLEAVNVQITRKWWLYEDPAAGVNDSLGSISAYSSSLAEMDLKAVYDADFVVALVPKESGVGMWIESGAALALGKPLYMVNIDSFDEKPVRRSIFDNLAKRMTLGDLLDTVKHDGA